MLSIDDVGRSEARSVLLLSVSDCNDNVGPRQKRMVNFRPFVLIDIRGWTFEPDLPANKSSLKLVIHHFFQTPSNPVKHLI